MSQSTSSSSPQSPQVLHDLPTVNTNANVPANTLAFVPPVKRKSGGNRMPRLLQDGSELVWPEELESALFEGTRLLTY
jgi:hypothetical protein